MEVFNVEKMGNGVIFVFLIIVIKDIILIIILNYVKLILVLVIINFWFLNILVYFWLFFCFGLFLVFRKCKKKYYNNNEIIERILS